MADLRRDLYAGLFRDGRGLGEEACREREEWLAEGRSERRVELVFELETLLKGIACFENERNLVGPPRLGPLVARDYTPEAEVLSAALERSLEILRRLLGKREQAFAFTRYLERVLPGDAERGRLRRGELAQTSPEGALYALRTALDAHHEVLSGLLRLPRIGHRLYHAFIQTLTREIARNGGFNPLPGLELRAEFDKLKHPELLSLARSLVGQSEHRLIMLTLLTLGRLSRVARLVERYAAAEDELPLALLTLGVYRADARSLGAHLERRAGERLAEGYLREVLALPREVAMARYQELEERADALERRRRLFGALGHSLGFEVRRCFEVKLPSIEAARREAEAQARFEEAAKELSAIATEALSQLYRELRPGEPVPRFDDAYARKAGAVRLRREVFMFAQILRAFLAKVEVAGRVKTSWADPVGFAFVREFVQHFQALGYGLLRKSDYEQLEPLVHRLEGMLEGEAVSLERVRAATAELQQLEEALTRLFGALGQRQELREETFDKKEAAEALRLYLTSR